jgi:hypothetical protein
MAASARPKRPLTIHPCLATVLEYDNWLIPKKHPALEFEVFISERTAHQFVQ